MLYQLLNQEHSAAIQPIMNSLPSASAILLHRKDERAGLLLRLRYMAIADSLRTTRVNLSENFPVTLNYDLFVKLQLHFSAASQTHARPLRIS